MTRIVLEVLRLLVDNFTLSGEAGLPLARDLVVLGLRAHPGLISMRPQMTEFVGSGRAPKALQPLVVVRELASSSRELRLCGPCGLARRVIFFQHRLQLAPRALESRMRRHETQLLGRPHLLIVSFGLLHGIPDRRLRWEGVRIDLAVQPLLGRHHFLRIGLEFQDIRIIVILERRIFALASVGLLMFDRVDQVADLVALDEPAPDPVYMNEHLDRLVARLPRPADGDPVRDARGNRCSLRQYLRVVIGGPHRARRQVKSLTDVVESPIVVVCLDQTTSYILGERCGCWIRQLVELPGPIPGHQVVVPGNAYRRSESMKLAHGFSDVRIGFTQHLCRDFR